MSTKNKKEGFLLSILTILITLSNLI